MVLLFKYLYFTFAFFLREIHNFLTSSVVGSKQCLYLALGCLINNIYNPKKLKLTLFLQTIFHIASEAQHQSFLKIY